MKKFLPFLLLIFLSAGAGAETLKTSCEGCRIERINIKTQHIKTSAVRAAFTLKEGQAFTMQAYEEAQQELHDMRVFKEIDFKLTVTQEKKVIIDIETRDGFYIFPLPFYSSSNGKSAFALAIAEGNTFRYGETSMLFFASGDDGTALSGALSVNNNTFQASFANMNFTQRFYEDGWSSNFGILDTSKDEGKFGAPLSEVYTKQDYFSLLYSRRAGPFSFWVSPAFEYVRYAPAIDNGSHNNMTFGVRYRKGERGGLNMGAMFGFGLSDKEKALRPLPACKLNYMASLAYTNGGGWTGADYDINKVETSFQTLYELKNRDALFLSINAADSFSSSFSNNIKSPDLLTGIGKYSRQLRGERGAGAGAAVSHYLLRNNTGLLSLQPFYEIAYVYESGKYRHHSGTGATIAYKFWRFPFPIGLNYTYNLSDSSDQLSFVFGGSF